MKKSLLRNTIICVVEAVMLFAILFSFNIISKNKQGPGAFASDTRITNQRLFTANSKEKLEEMDTLFKSKYDFYHGYSYYGITTKAVDAKNKPHYIYMASESINLSWFFYELSEGEYLYTSNITAEFPIIVGGEFYSSAKIGDSIPLTIEATNGGSSKSVNATIVGKVNKRMYRWPEAVSNEMMIDMAVDGFIVSTDKYLSELVDLTTKKVLLNSEYSTNIGDEYIVTTELLNQFKEEAEQYGSLSSFYEANFEMWMSILEYKNLFIGILVAAIIFVVLINLLLIIKFKAKGLAEIVVPHALMVIIGGIIMLIYNSLSGILKAYRMPMVYFVFFLCVAVACSLIMLLRYKSVKKADKLLHESQHNEKL